MDLGLDGKVALVTGASRGIGKAVAAALLDAGANVMISSRKQDSLDATVAELAPLGKPGAIAAFAANAGEADQAAACVAATVERFGSVDVLVNNAATNPYFGPLIDIDLPRAEKTVQVNQTGPLLWTQAAWRASMQDRGGVVVNMASIGAFTVEEPGFAFYNVTKAALVHMTRQLASELAPMVRVNAVAPGFVRTDMTRSMWQEHEASIASRVPLRRLGDAHDVAKAVLFLAGDASSWVTGETLVVDGGMMVKPSPMLSGVFT